MKLPEHTWFTSSVTGKSHLYVAGDDVSSCGKASSSLVDQKPGPKCLPCRLIEMALSQHDTVESRRTSRARGLNSVVVR